MSIQKDYKNEIFAQNSTRKKDFENSVVAWYIQSVYDVDIDAGVTRITDRIILRNTVNPMIFIEYKKKLL